MPVASSPIQRLLKSLQCSRNRMCALRPRRIGLFATGTHALRFGQAVLFYFIELAQYYSIGIQPAF